MEVGYTYLGTASSHMSKTSNQCPLPTLTFDTQLWHVVRPGVQGELVLVALSFALYGIFFGLCTASIYFLLRNGRDNERARRTTAILALALLALFASTTAYTVTSFLVAQEQVFGDVVGWGLRLWSVDAVYDPAPIGTYGTAGQLLSCVPTAALTINILLGDAIVCWRACVVWQGRRLVAGTCVVLLLITFALGVVDTNSSCGSTSAMGELYQEFTYGVAATVLSLTTNLFATVAVAVRAWRSRKTLKQYLAIGGVSQAERVLSLLVESGAIYCALWILVIAWQAGTYDGPGEARAYRTYDNFWDVFDVFMNGALVPTIAIYPTVIIVLVSLNRSHVERGFLETVQDRLHLPPLRRPVTEEIDVTVTTRCETQPPRLSQIVLDVDEKDLVPKEGAGDSSTHTVEERKHEDIV